MRRRVRGTAVPLVISVRDYGYSCATRTLMHDGREICDGPSLMKCLKCATHRYGAAKSLAAVGGVFVAKRGLRRQVKAIHAVSRFVCNIVARDLVGQNATQWTPPVLVIPDISPPENAGADLADGADTRRLPSDPFILFVGQLQRHKGLNWLLAAYREMVDPCSRHSC